MDTPLRLTMLGTGMAIVRHCYNTCFVISGGGEHLLVDGGGGNGLLWQLQRAGLPWQDMRHIFVTHTHIDHILGIIWLMRLFAYRAMKAPCRGNSDTCVHIYGCKEVTAALHSLAHTLLMPQEAAQIGKAIRLVTVSDDQTAQVGPFDMRFFDIHSTKTPQFGFVLQHSGLRLVCCGDEPATEPVFHHIKDCDWLLHEAFCLYSERDTFKPHEKHHSTVREACELAQSLQVKNLVLYHTEDSHGPRRKELYQAEGRHLFSGGLYVPNDLDTILLTS